MKNLILSVLVLFNFHFVSSKDFLEIEKLISKIHNKKMIEKALQEEMVLYKSTNDHKHFLNAKYLDAFICGFTGRRERQMYLFLWIIENCRKEDLVILAHTNYHFATMLKDNGTFSLSLKYVNRALFLSEMNKLNALSPLCYSLKGLNYYKIQQFVKSEKEYLKAFNFTQENVLFRSSMLNNVSLCESKRKNFSKSNGYIFKSLNTLAVNHHLNQEERLFQVIVEGNLGSNYFYLNDFSLAKKYLEKEVEYYDSTSNFLVIASSPLKQLLEIYIIEQNQKSVKKTIELVILFERKMANLEDKNQFLEILLFYFNLCGDSLKSNYYASKIIANAKLIAHEKAYKTANLFEVLFEQKVNLQKSQFEKNAKLLNTKTNSSKYITFFLIVCALLIVVIFSFVFIEKLRRDKKNKLIAIQNQSLGQKRRMILENELKLRQEKIANLAMILTLKKETEFAFLTKLKELKKRKSINTEEVIKDLQFSVTNLLEIDKKLINTSVDEVDFNKKFKTLLSKKHPNLTTQDLEFCCYFKLNLSAKEIGAIHSLSDISVRVYKNKIKNKIGLAANDDLNSYIHSILV